MNTKDFAARELVEWIQYHGGQRDKLFSLYIQTFCIRKGLSKQELANRLHISIEQMTFLRTGLVHAVDVPEYLHSAMEAEFGCSYTDFVDLLRSPDESKCLPASTTASSVNPTIAFDCVGVDHREPVDDTPGLNEDTSHINRVVAHRHMMCATN